MGEELAGVGQPVGSFKVDELERESRFGELHDDE